MLIQQGQAPVLSCAADVPINTAGVLSYGNPSSYWPYVNGVLRAGLGTVASSQTIGTSCYSCSINTNTGDFPATGPGVILLYDASNNVVGSIPIQVVGYNPYLP